MMVVVVVTVVDKWNVQIVVVVGEIKLVIWEDLFLHHLLLVIVVVVEVVVKACCGRHHLLVVRGDVDRSAPEAWVYLTLGLASVEPPAQQGQWQHQQDQNAVIKS